MPARSPAPPYSSPSPPSSIVSSVGDTRTPVTLKFTPALASLPTVTTTAPVLAPAGTGTTIEVSLQLTGDASVPAKLTRLVPRFSPKFEPVIVTLVPTGPAAGFSPLIAGTGTVSSSSSVIVQVAAS